MKLLAMMMFAGFALTGCKVMPDLSDTTNPTMRFRIHYETPGLGTPMVEIATTVSTAANRCVYVNEPFGIVANVADPGGIRSIVIGPSGAPFDGVKARTGPGDTVAIPAPAEKTQVVSGATVANPGVPGAGAVVQVLYSTVKSFDTVTLLSVYEFNGVTRAAMRGTARNWGSTTGPAEVFHFHVEKAQPGDPARQAGMPCKLP